MVFISFLVLHRRFSNLWITELKKKLVNDEIQIRKIYMYIGKYNKLNN